MGVTINDLESKATLTGTEQVEIDTNGLSQKTTLGDIADFVRDNTTFDTELSKESNNAIANSAVTKALKTKQDTLTLTTKPNGNIVIGNLAGQSKEFMPATPSGDPMHSWYESLGAVWNATTGYWEFLGVNDMTNEDMLEEAILGNSRIYPTANLMSYTATARVVFGQKNMLLDKDWAAVKADNLVANNRNLEVIQFTTYKDYPVFLSSFTWACANCSKLRKILNILNVSLGNIYSAFNGCVSLEEVKLQGVKKDVSFADSPLSVESATYTIANADASASFAITFRADRQAIYEANSDFITAKKAKPNITILYK